MSKKDWLILGILACIITAMVFWYEYSRIKPEPAPLPSFEEVLMDDNALVEGAHPISVYYESTIVFDSLGVASITNVFQSMDTCTIFRHVGSQLDVEEIEDYWLEDNAIDIPLPITLDSAITLYNNSEYAQPLHVCVVRNPLGPELGNPRYIFGTVDTGFTAVDAITSEVTPIE